MPTSGTSSAQRRAAKWAPPNRAMASTGEKFGGCGSSRVSAASTISPASTSGPGEMDGEAEAVAGRFIEGGSGIGWGCKHTPAHTRRRHRWPGIMPR